MRQRCRCALAVCSINETRLLNNRKECLKTYLMLLQLPRPGKRNDVIPISKAAKMLGKKARQKLETPSELRRQGMWRVFAVS